MKIRKPKKSDEKDIAELDKQFWEIHANIDPFIAPAKKLSEKDHLKHARSAINNKKKNNFYFVAELDEKVVGIINFKIKKNPKFFKLKKFGYIDLITVNKKYRSKGVGRALSNFALGFLKKKGISYSKFHTNWKNKSAIKAFKKMGFEEKNIMFYKKV